ncbi:MAG: PDZ domain-containing protein [Phycisphaerae bacterium]|nr:PDZ domain-containing protein [Phycisphaerae bacterium]
MRRAVWTVLLVAATCGPLVAAPESTTTRPAADEVRRLCAGSITRALAGEFRKAYDLAAEAHRLAPDNDTAAEAERLLQKYLAQRDRADQQRHEAYTDAVARVRRAMMAQAHRQDLDAEEPHAAIRETLNEAFEIYNGVSGTIDAVDRALREAFAAEGDEDAVPRETAQSQRDAAVHQLASITERLSQAKQQLVAETDSAYADTFADLCDRAAERGEALAATWRKLPESADALWDWTQRLRRQDDELAQALADVDGMVAPKPWQTALAQGGLARRLADGIDVSQTDWYARLVEGVEARARSAVAEARWHDALAAYGGLKDVNPDSQTYRDKVDRVRRHVRVLGLYAPPEDEADGPDAEPPAWRERVSGVDAEMVKSAISQLDMYYVTRVEYRQVAREALESVRVLAETPQAAETFTGLADKDKRDRFLDAVQRQIDNITARDRVDHVDLLLAFNAVLRASERSVEVPPEVLAVEFTDGLLAALDKFTAMIWPSDLTDFEKKTMGHFTGVGIQITKEPGEPLKVVTPLADSPALQAGIRSGDRIVAVDGTPTRDLGINKLVTMIMGEAGTKVVLTIERHGQPAPFDVPVIRDRIEIRTVKGWRRAGEQWQYLLDADAERRAVGYIRLEQFTGKTPEELREALKDLSGQLEARDATLQSLVLDLRFNPGGLLPAAREVANQFLSHGRIVSTRGRQKRPRELDADSDGMYLDGDLVVLVNDGSASAAEIVSGALKDWDRAMIIGERTYGKGSVQNVIPIRSRRARLKLTTAYYYLPKGRLLHRKNGKDTWGVDPDIAVTMPPKQMKRWLELRRRTGLLLDHESEHLDEDLRQQYRSDIQLQTAVLVLKLMRLRQAAESTPEEGYARDAA